MWTAIAEYLDTFAMGLKNPLVGVLSIYLNGLIQHCYYYSKYAHWNTEIMGTTCSARTTMKQPTHQRKKRSNMKTPATGCVAFKILCKMSWVAFPKTMVIQWNKCPSPKRSRIRNPDPLISFGDRPNPAVVWLVNTPDLAKPYIVPSHFKI